MKNPKSKVREVSVGVKAILQIIGFFLVWAILAIACELTKFLPH